MALQYGWILPICLILTTNSVFGQNPSDSFNDFVELQGAAFDSDDVSDEFARNSSELRLSALRGAMVELNFDAYIVPTADAHNSAQIAPTDARRAWLTGFNGGAGTAVVTANRALVWTDGRYWTQFEIETNGTAWELMREGVDANINDWLVANLQSGSRVGADPTTYTGSAWSTLQGALRAANVLLEISNENLVDIARRMLNDDPPRRPNEPLLTLSQVFSGRSASNKVAEVIERMRAVEASALVLTRLDDIAYMLNLRGSDIPFSTVFFSYLVIRADIRTNNVILFWGDGTLATDVTAHLVAENQPVVSRAYADIVNYLTQLTFELGSNGKIWIPADANQVIFLSVQGGPAQVIVAPISPVALMKVIKNPVELQGYRNSHIRDAVAVIRALCWIELRLASREEVREIELSAELDRLRGLGENFVTPSFASIVGSGPNGAIIHYRPSENGSRIIGNNDMLLVDSGGHYLDGSTDITRTRHMGVCTPAQRDAFTRVLKGNINLATALMPTGTMGHTVDILARKYLWDVGLNYAHGTGHGVGHFLNIHEFPARINTAPFPNDPGISPSMIYSNEPGYYEVGQYGIRHEDIVETIAVTNTTNHPLAANLTGNFLGQGIVGFSAITQVPHQTSCLDVKLMTEFEINYLNDFHARILETVGPVLLQQNLTVEHAWLEKECRAISAANILVKSSPLLAVISIVVMWLGK